MKITIEYDTETKMVDVMLGDSKVENLESISIYKRYYYEDDDPNKYSISVSTSEDMGEEVKKYVNISASEKLQHTMANLLKVNK